MRSWRRVDSSVPRTLASLSCRCRRREGRLNGAYLAGAGVLSDQRRSLSSSANHEKTNDDAAPSREALDDQAPSNAEGADSFPTSLRNLQTKVKSASGQLKIKYDSEYEQFITNFGQKWQALIGNSEGGSLDSQVPPGAGVERLTLGHAPISWASKTRSGKKGDNNSKAGNNSASSSLPTAESSVVTAMTTTPSAGLRTESKDSKSAESKLDSLLSEYLRLQSLLGGSVKELWTSFANKPRERDSSADASAQYSTLKRMLNLQSSVLKSFFNLEKQVEKYDKVDRVPPTLMQRFQAIKATIEANSIAEIASVQNLKRLLRDLENEEARVNREKFDRRKVYLREKCFAKLYAGPASPYKSRNLTISGLSTELEADHADEVTRSLPWTGKFEDVDEDDEDVQDPVPSFEGNWTGMQLKRDEISEKPATKAMLEGSLKLLLYDLRQSRDEASTMERLLELTRILRANPSLRTIVREENFEAFLLRRLDAAPPGPKRAVLRETLTMCGHSLPLPRRGVRILAIDGGGIRALMSVLMLKRLQEECGGVPLQQLFDYVAGVSTGSILATMSAIYDCPIDDCLKLYRIMSVEVFKRNILKGASKLVTNHAYYDSNYWNQLLQRDCGALELSETARCSTIPKMAIVSSAVNLPRLTPYIFRNYNHPPNSPSKFPGTADAMVWQALRASSAAPGIFEEFRVRGVLHQDGGLMVNNPAALAVHEARLLWPDEPIQCVVSLGTGRYYAGDRPELDTSSLKEKIVKLIDGATDTECVHTMLQDFLPKGAYFRFNPYMSEDTLLDESRPEKLDQLINDGELYLRKNRDKIRVAAARLLEPRGRWQRIADASKGFMSKYC